ncbi:MAG: winged helix-turn-helix domain-containing protein [Armatimonadota bacterium]
MNNIPVETVKFSRKAYELPLLKTIIDFGGEVVPGDELYFSIAEKMGFVDNQGEYDITHAKPKWVYTLQWVRFQLTKTGEIDGTKRGVWKITDLGIQRVNAEWSNYNRNQFITASDANDSDEPRDQINIPTDLRNFIDNCLDRFYQNLESKMLSIELQDILTQVNPYVLRLTCSQQAHVLIISFLEKFIKSEAESTINELVLDPLSNQIDSSIDITQLLAKLPISLHSRFDVTRDTTINRLTNDFLNQFLLDNSFLFDYKKMIEYQSLLNL